MERVIGDVAKSRAIDDVEESAGWLLKNVVVDVAVALSILGDAEKFFEFEDARGRENVLELWLDRAGAV